MGSQVLLRCCWAWRYAGHGEYWRVGGGSGAWQLGWGASASELGVSRSFYVLAQTGTQEAAAVEESCVRNNGLASSVDGRCSGLWQQVVTTVTTAAPPMLACMTTWKGKAYGHACSVVWLAPLDGLTDVDLREQDLSDRRPA